MPTSKKIGAITQFWRGCTQQHTLRLHMLWGSNEATLPASGISQVHLPATTTGLDNARHHKWSWKLDVRWKGWGISNVIPYFHRAIFQDKRPLVIFNSYVSVIHFFCTLVRLSNLTNLAVTSWHISCFLSPSLYGSVVALPKWQKWKIKFSQPCGTLRILF